MKSLNKVKPMVAYCAILAVVLLFGCAQGLPSETTRLNKPQVSFRAQLIELDSYWVKATVMNSTQDTWIFPKDIIVFHGNDILSIADVGVKRINTLMHCLVVPPGSTVSFFEAVDIPSNADISKVVVELAELDLSKSQTTDDTRAAVTATRLKTVKFKAKLELAPAN